ncbi:MAG: SMC-Scp complex subunit ScpB [Clostridiaceae bacterium]|nr:SMC-Scp complex subunit ScpB [Clostridiaceae bacterium]
MDIENLSHALEAILFTAGDPVSLDRLQKTLGQPREAIDETLLKMRDRLAFERSGLRLVRMEDSWQFCTAPEYAAVVRETLETRRPPALSGAALEVLAIVAYRGPVTRAFIEKVRGVDSSYTVSSLCDRGILEEAGRLEAPGHPILYRCASAALRILGVSSLSELPPLPQGEELLGSVCGDIAGPGDTAEDGT